MKLLKTGQAAEILGVSPSTIKHWIRMGQLKTIKTPGGRNLIPEYAVNAILLKQDMADEMAESTAELERLEKEVNKLVKA